MAWIKKNLTLVLGGLVGLVLLGGSAFFLYTQYSREAAVNTALEEKRAEWNRLMGLNPFPEDKNIKAFKDDAARLEKLTVALKERIKPVQVQSVSDTFSLKVLIENTIADLRKEAEQSGVGLPHNYAFTFQRLREMAQFESNSIPKLAEQVGEISTLCRVLFDAKIHTLDTFRRSPVLKEESSSGGSDYLSKKPQTDALVTRAPYDFSFRAFSGELAQVLKGFAALDHCVVIKTINIVPTSLPQSNESPTPGMMPGSPMMMPNPAMMPGGGPRPGGMDPALAARYGMMPGGPNAGMGRPGEGGGAGPGGMDAALASRYGMSAMRSRYGGALGGGAPGGGGQATAFSQPAATMPSTMAPAAPSGPSVVLEEKPLRVVFQIDFVKPKAAGDAPTKRSSARAEGDAAAAPAADAGAAAPAADATEKSE